MFSITKFSELNYFYFFIKTNFYLKQVQQYVFTLTTKENHPMIAKYALVNMKH
jgi:hypothetical protein